MAPFTRNADCPECGRGYCVSGAALNPGSETEVLAQFRCSCGQWMGAFVPGSVNTERLIVTLRSDDSVVAEPRLVPETTRGEPVAARAEPVVPRGEPKTPAA